MLAWLIADPEHRITGTAGFAVPVTGVAYWIGHHRIADRPVDR